MRFFLSKTVLLLDQINEAIGRTVAWLTLALVLVSFAVVVLRYAFTSGNIALQETTTYLHSLIFMLGAAYTLKHDKHVRVDILFRPSSPHCQARVNLFGTLLILFPVCIVLFYFAWDYVAAAWAIQESSQQTGGLPYLYLLKSCLLLLPVLLLLQGLAELGRNWLLLTTAAETRHD
ncbi:TRAP transporter small permease subunit [Pontibacter sp. JAM-7]|uniref:TRAP transporter small permease subunit n=1 Tax=Pontibacter sp. JAM-7 TaxID=3366581 RepID=UPI003AF7E064